MTEIPIAVTLRHNPSGEVRVYNTTDYIVENQWCDFSWSEGNYACDCNRAVFFARAGNEEEPDVDCTEGDYTILSIVRRDTNELLYQE